eukprot:GHVN01031776.1.p1 GENE.GHVN01031776.1~~GHVN01031776.1.p1  ORF type:complete len:256 (+),score=64.34 GHVN01031776.1:108-875(+)
MIRYTMRFIFLVDCTASMTTYCDDLPTSLISTIRALRFIYPYARFTVARYRDYIDPSLAQAEVPVSSRTGTGTTTGNPGGEEARMREVFVMTKSEDDDDEVIKFCETELTPRGGGVMFEAQKTAFIKLLPFVSEASEVGVPTVILHFTDSGPHQFRILSFEGREEIRQFTKRRCAWFNLVRDLTRSGWCEVITFTNNTNYYATYHLIMGEVILCNPRGPDSSFNVINHDYDDHIGNLLVNPVNSSKDITHAVTSV